MVQEEMVKGRIAEAIVKCMFEDLGFEVIPYGYEHTCPTIANKEKVIQGEVSKLIRKAPDFIIVDKDKNAYFIEVKYRAGGVYKKEIGYPYRECYIILLSKDYIGIEQYKNLNDKTTMNSKDFDPVYKSKSSRNFKSLMDVPLFRELDKKIILDYRTLLRKYMKD